MNIDELPAATESTDAGRSECRRPGPISSSFRLRSPSLNSVRLRRIFDIFDKNKDSIISVEELTQALNLLGLDTDLCDLRSTVRSYIQPGQAGLTFQDFEALHRSLNDVFYGLQEQDEDHDDRDADSAASSRKAKERARRRLQQQQQEESDLSEAFKVFDEDGDGYISARELQAVLGKLGLQEEGREMDRVEMMISSVDLNHDGLVDFFEFKDMMRTIIVPSA